MTQVKIDFNASVQMLLFWVKLRALVRTGRNGIKCGRDPYMMNARRPEEKERKKGCFIYL